MGTLSEILFISAAFDAPPATRPICIMICVFVAIITLISIWSFYRSEEKDGMAYAGFITKKKDLPVRIQPYDEHGRFMSTQKSKKK